MGLFDSNHKHYHNYKTEYIPYEKNVKINVTENRATTDSSVALLNDFTKKAQDNIIRSIKIDNNNLKCIAIFYQDGFLSDCVARVHLHVRFILNERCYFIKESFDHFEFYRNTAYDEKEGVYKHEGFNNDRAIKFVYERLSNVIALALINDQPEVFESLISTLSFSFKPLRQYK